MAKKYVKTKVRDVNGEFVEVYFVGGGGSSSGIGEAPTDGNQYTRGGRNWNKLTVDNKLNDVSPNPVSNSAVSKEFQSLKSSVRKFSEAAVTKVVSHHTADTSITIPPNELHIWDTVASLNIKLASPTDPSIENDYMIQFTSGTQPTTLILPASVKWIGSKIIESNRTYQVSILNDLAIMGGA